MMGRLQTTQDDANRLRQQLASKIEITTNQVKSEYWQSEENKK
jgi:hypothetical protein